jgi:hypothetical protein
MRELAVIVADLKDAKFESAIPEEAGNIIDNLFDATNFDNYKSMKNSIKQAQSLISKAKTNPIEDKFFKKQKVIFKYD